MDQEQKKKELRRKAMQLPLSPGVYIMHNKAGDIIYIGKAKALKNRVSQYFGSEKNHDNKVRRMVSNVDWFEYILCDSEFEALVLESSLIKQHKPKYRTTRATAMCGSAKAPGPALPRSSRWRRTAPSTSAPI